jgi:hypothetical protein
MATVLTHTFVNIIPYGPKSLQEEMVINQRTSQQCLLYRNLCHTASVSCLLTLWLSPILRRLSPINTDRSKKDSLFRHHLHLNKLEKKSILHLEILYSLFVLLFMSMGLDRLWIAATYGLIIYPHVTYEYREPRRNDRYRREPKNSEKNLSHCCFVHHKSHTDWPGRGLRPPRWEAGE